MTTRPTRTSTINFQFLFWNLVQEGALPNLRAAADGDGEVAAIPKMRSKKRGKFPVIVLDKPGLKESYIRLSDTVGKDWKDMRSICGSCGQTKSKSCRAAKPIGLLWSWLRHDCVGDRTAHRSFNASLEERRGARQEFFDTDGTEEWFHAECPDGDKGFLDEPEDA